MLVGIYVLDLNDDKVFVIGASSFSESRFAAHNILKKIDGGPFDIEGSYHYFPVKEGETMHQAEARIIENIAELIGEDNVITRSNVETSEKALFRIQSAADERCTKNEQEIFRMSL